MEALQWMQRAMLGSLPLMIGPRFGFGSVLKMVSAYQNALESLCLSSWALEKLRFMLQVMFPLFIFSSVGFLDQTMKAIFMMGQFFENAFGRIILMRTYLAPSFSEVGQMIR